MIALDDDRLVRIRRASYFPRSLSWRVSFEQNFLIRHATKLGEYVGIMGLIPIAKARPQELRIGGPGRALDDKMLAVEKIRRIIRIASHIRRESRQRRKRCVGQLPAVADQFMNSPAARSAGTRTDGHRRPRGEIEIAVTVDQAASSPQG